MRQSGGYARIASEVGRGTRVTLYFPRHCEADEPEAEPAALRAQSGAGESVFVVDDEDSVRELVVEMLTEEGYRALDARDAKTALEILGGPERFDLQIADVGLSGPMNGRQLVAAARRRRPELKALFIAGYAESAGVEAGSQAGAAFMAKPLTLAALGAKIRDLLDAK